jgi:hypothetical protein
MKQLDHWRNLVLEEMTAILKPLGFKKRGTNFRRRQETDWMVLNLQSSSWNSEGRSMQVYGNLGLLYAVGEANLKDPKAGPAADLCHWQGRVPGNRGQAWLIDSDSIAVEAGQSIARNGLAILEQVVERYPTAEILLAAREHSRTLDRDLTGWSQCAFNIIRRDLGLPLK